MGVEVQELIDQLRAVDPFVDPDEVAAQLLLSSSNWFEGMAPATSWVLTWLDSVGKRDVIQSALRLAVRGGYRHGRRMLGTETWPHPAVGDEALCDDQADMLCTVSFEIATGDFYDRLPIIISAVHRSLAILVAAVNPVDESMLSLEERARICHFGANIGFVVAMVEHKVAALKT